MSNDPIRVFISYSHLDESFAFRLYASLKERNVDAWIDQSKMEGGKDFLATIAKAIDACQYVLLILSPSSVQSRWVGEEIAYTLANGKSIVPVMLQSTKVPFGISSLNIIDFTKTAYQRGLDEILYALNISSLLPLPQNAPPVKESDQRTEAPARVIPPRQSEIQLVDPRPTAPEPDIDINTLYVEGIDAFSKDDLERAEVFLNRVVLREPKFAFGDAAVKLETIRQQLHQRRVKRLEVSARQAEQSGQHDQAISQWRQLLQLEPDHREAKAALITDLRNHAEAVHQNGQQSEEIDLWQQLLQLDSSYTLATQPLLMIFRAIADKAYVEGRWNDEIAAWNDVLGIAMNDSQATERKLIAEQNQEASFLYINAQNFVRQNNNVAARDQLQQLWKRAPYYGDPAGIAKTIQMIVPATIQSVEVDRKNAKTAQEYKVATERADQELRVKLEKAAQEQERELEKRRKLATTLLLWLGSPIISSFIFIGSIPTMPISDSSENGIFLRLLGGLCFSLLEIPFFMSGLSGDMIKLPSLAFVLSGKNIKRFIRVLVSVIIASITVLAVFSYNSGAYIFNSGAIIGFGISWSILLLAYRYFVYRRFV